MTISGFLPQRWRSSPDLARHAEAVAGVLHTPPLQPTHGGPAVVSLIGTVHVLPYLVAIKSLRRALGRGSIAVVDDGTLTGEDRAILAHHCGDPEILPHHAVDHRPFPAGADWALLLSVLDRRAGRYWIALDPYTVTLAEMPEVEQAIASNRSLAAAGGGLTGFAAGGNARAFLHRQLAALGEGATVALALERLLAAETGPVLLPAERYGSRDAAAFVHFPNGPSEGPAYAEASRAAIAALAS